MAICATIRWKTGAGVRLMALGTGAESLDIPRHFSYNGAVLSRIRTRLKRLPKIPFVARHGLYSYASSLDDEPGRADPELIRLSLEIATEALNTTLEEVSARMKEPPFYPDVWPGEHYRLLAAAVKILRPRVVVEVGMHQGMGALSFLKHLPPDGKVYTFDLLKWNEVPGTLLRESDFEDGRLQVCQGDLTNATTVRQYQGVLRSADLLFLDAAKDGECEPKLWRTFEEVGLKEGALVIFDDIKEWNMLRFWREIQRPKIDLTSFGHWSGTGVVRWTRSSAG